MTVELDSVTAETMLAFFREQSRTQPGAELQGALAARLANAIQAARSERDALERLMSDKDVGELLEAAGIRLVLK